MNRKDTNSDNEKLTLLQNNVADFGAKIKDLSINVASLKGHINDIQKNENENISNITTLMVFIIVQYILLDL